MTQKAGRIELTDPKAYQARMDSLLGDRDPLQVLAETPDILARLVAQRSAETLRRRPFAGKWTPNEIIGHLVDAEWTLGFRMRTILCDDEPTIIGMDQERWVSRQKHNDRDPSALVEEFGALRRFNLTVWKRMSPGDLERIGKHSERGDESLGRMLRMLAGHDLSHVDQISRYLAAGGKA